MGSYRRFPKTSAASEPSVRREREWREAALGRAWDEMKSVRHFRDVAGQESLGESMRTGRRLSPAQRTLH